RPKLAGVLALQQALTGRSLDFLCLFSSISSRTGGGPGQVDYCAANAFLEAYARQHAGAHGCTMAVAWGEWQWNAWEKGLEGFPDDVKAYFIAKRQRFGLSFADGCEALGRVLANGLTNSFVATQDFAAMVEGSKSFSIATILAASQRVQARRPSHPRPPLMVSYRAPQSAAERRLC
ncbi:ketoreductase domain-containing protein, partial [Mesorhizobium sp. M0772]|uniref:ketoreductase domain-containing protein n=1 Tax=Mesorhizobium sp. M0772 TaxID=2956998 RepID=UPI00333893DF